jgi:UDP-glucose 4-epimerase
MHFAVTGGAGFVGSHLVNYLIKEGHSVSVIDNLSYGKKQNLTEVFDRIKFYQKDIRDFDALKKILKNVDGVFHQAALTIVQDSLKKPQEYRDVNVLGTENVFKLAKEYGLKVVFASSSSVYGHKENMPISENAERKPINPYGQTKLDDEYLFERYSNLGLSVIGLRYFNIFGKGQTLAYSGVITKFLDRIKKSKPPIIFGDGSQIRDFVFVGDVVKANLAAMENESSNLLVNIGSGKDTSILRLAEMMIDLSGLPLKVVFQEPLEGDVHKSHADIGLSRKLLKWEPKMELETWLLEKITDEDSNGVQNLIR